MTGSSRGAQRERWFAAPGAAANSPDAPPPAADFLLCVVRRDAGARRRSAAEPLRHGRYRRGEDLDLHRQRHDDDAAFVRKAGVFSSTYSAKVFPYFFYNEKGKLTIEVSDDALRKLERGETIEFTGHGVSSEGEQRASKAVPSRRARPAEKSRCGSLSQRRSS